MATLLAIETSTPRGSVSLIKNQEIVKELFTDTIQTHAATLLPTIETLLNETNEDIKNLTGIAVSIGPGAFTGLRVGISTAQGLAQTLKIPIYSVPTLEALAYGAIDTRNPIFTTIDARKDEIYGALFQWQGEELIRLINESVLTPEEWCITLSEKLNKTQFIICGTGYLKYKNKFAIYFQNQINELPFELLKPSSINVGKAGLKYKSLKLGTTPNKIKVLYIRNP